ncbi:hypothetical protein ABHN05_19850 [Brevibacillus laterosporus]|uniref:hypothetical protein n=1 Tax=Brevibacillus laterosporus TaxID=1465 RepID=UPI000369E0A6|nr:hypothetical protein [Brevibacillus laterosporus]MED4765875.1 hypothetical protein [Brevibacillus laterosporus]
MKVVIGPGISEGEAEARLMEDSDTFARTRNLAKEIFYKVTRDPEIHGHSFYLGIN